MATNERTQDTFRPSARQTRLAKTVEWCDGLRQDSLSLPSSERKLVEEIIAKRMAIGRFSWAAGDRVFVVLGNYIQAVKNASEEITSDEGILFLEKNGKKLLSGTRDAGAATRKVIALKSRSIDSLSRNRLGDAPVPTSTSRDIAINLMTDAKQTLHHAPAQMFLDQTAKNFLFASTAAQMHDLTLVAFFTGKARKAARNLLASASEDISARNFVGHHRATFNLLGIDAPEEHDVSSAAPPPSAHASASAPPVAGEKKNDYSRYEISCAPAVEAWCDDFVDYVGGDHLKGEYFVKGMSQIPPVATVSVDLPEAAQRVGTPEKADKAVGDGATAEAIVAPSGVPLASAGVSKADIEEIRRTIFSLKVKARKEIHNPISCARVEDALMWQLSSIRNDLNGHAASAAEDREKYEDKLFDLVDDAERVPALKAFLVKNEEELRRFASPIAGIVLDRLHEQPEAEKMTETLQASSAVAVPSPSASVGNSPSISSTKEDATEATTTEMATLRESPPHETMIPEIKAEKRAGSGFFGTIGDALSTAFGGIARSVGGAFIVPSCLTEEPPPPVEVPAVKETLVAKPLRTPAQAAHVTFLALTEKAEAKPAPCYSRLTAKRPAPRKRMVARSHGRSTMFYG